MINRDTAVKHKGDQLLMLASQRAMISERVGDANHLGMHLGSKFLLSTLNSKR